MHYDGATVKDWAGASQWRAWLADLSRFRSNGYSGWGSPGFWAITFYRIQHSLRKARPRFLWIIIRIPVAILKKLFETISHISIDSRAVIGPGLIIPHIGPININPQAVIGADCAIHQVCTIGAGSSPGGPRIGDHVMIGCHSCILGPVNIGDGAKIGAGAVVVTDIPAGCTAVGVPAKPLKPGSAKDGNGSTK